MGLLYILPKPLLCRNSEFSKFNTLNSLYQLLQLKTSHKITIKTQCLHKPVQCKTKQATVYTEPVYKQTHQAQSVTCQSVMLNSMVIASRTIIELSATQDGPITEIQPKILREVTFLTLPATWRNFLSIIQLKEVSSMSVYKFIQYFSKTQCFQLLT